MNRIAFQMQIKPGAAAEYERRHNPIWPELEAAIFAHGGRNYSIFLDGDSGRLFGFAEVDDVEAWSRIPETEVCQRWWAHMADLMVTNPDGSPAATTLREVFRIENSH